MPLACDYQQGLAVQAANGSVEQSVSMSYDYDTALQFAYIAARLRLGAGNNRLALEFAKDAMDARYPI